MMRSLFHSGLGADKGASPVEAAHQAGIRTVRAVNDVAQSALADAVTRELCYLHDQEGCGRFGVNEDHGNDKAAQERTATVAPLTAVTERTSRWLVDEGDKVAEVPLVEAKLASCSVLKAQIDAKFTEFKGVPYHDPVRRNNIRGEMMTKGRAMVSCLAAVRAKSPAGKALIRRTIEAALSASRARVTCYTTKASGCDKSGVSEPSHTDKAAEERRVITTPLEQLLARPDSALGQVDDEEGPSLMPWLVGGAVLVGGFLILNAASKPKRRTRRNPRRRRTSRRARRTSRRTSRRPRTSRRRRPR
jgi:hypothetical protein